MEGGGGEIWTGRIVRKRERESWGKGGREEWGGSCHHYLDQRAVPVSTATAALLTRLRGLLSDKIGSPPHPTLAAWVAPAHDSLVILFKTESLILYKLPWTSSVRKYVQSLFFSFWPF